MMLRVFASEWLKIRRSLIWLPVLIAPLLAIVTGALAALDLREGEVLTWDSLYLMSITYYGMLFLPLVAGVYASMVCRFEHLAGGWKQLLALPIKRSHLYLCKLILVAALLALTQLLLLAGVLLIGLVLDIGGAVPWGMILESLLRGWFACLPIAGLQLWASISWKSFGAPFALNAILTLPAVLIANSETYGPYYPWAQPLLGMLPADNGMFLIPQTTLTTVILVTTVLAVGGGWTHFVRRDVQA